MTPVNQTIVSSVNGNCFQAALATIFDINLNDALNIIDCPQESWHLNLIDWCESIGWSWNGCAQAESMSVNGGVNGYYIASVPSKNFESSSHAVVVDSDCNVVHDPDPSKKWQGRNVKNAVDYIYDFSKA